MPLWLLELGVWGSWLVGKVGGLKLGKEVDCSEEGWKFLDGGC